MQPIIGPHSALMGTAALSRPTSPCLLAEPTCPARFAVDHVEFFRGAVEDNGMRQAAHLAVIVAYSQMVRSMAISQQISRKLHDVGFNRLHYEQAVPVTGVQMSTQMNICVFTNGWHVASNGVVLQVPMIQAVRSLRVVVQVHVDFVEMKARKGIRISSISLGELPVPTSALIQ